MAEDLEKVEPDLGSNTQERKRMKMSSKNEFYIVVVDEVEIYKRMNFSTNLTITFESEE